MGDDQRKPGSDLFIVDNSDADWKVRNYLTEWCGLAKTIDIATGYSPPGSEILNLKSLALFAPLNSSTLELFDTSPGGRTIVAREFTPWNPSLPFPAPPATIPDSIRFRRTCNSENTSIAAIDRTNAHKFTLPATPWDPDNPHPLSTHKTELVWEGALIAVLEQQKKRLCSVT